MDVMSGTKKKADINPAKQAPTKKKKLLRRRKGHWTREMTYRDTLHCPVVRQRTSGQHGRAHREHSPLFPEGLLPKAMKGSSKTEIYSAKHMTKWKTGCN